MSQTQKTVLITRPRDVAAPLIAALHQQGLQTIAFPTIEIKTKLPEPSSYARQDLARAQLLIFISQYAARIGWPWIKALQLSTLSDWKIAAVGESTANVLAELGVTPIITPQCKPYQSETLLVHPALQQVANQTIVIVRGVGGRELLKETLRTRGAHVHYLEVYERIQPQPNAQQVATFWQMQNIDVVITTSAATLTHLMVMLAEKQANLLQTPLIVVSEAMQQQAQSLGFLRVYRANGADTPALLDALRALPVEC